MSEHATDSIADDRLRAYARLADQIEDFRVQQRERHYASFGAVAPPLAFGRIAPTRFQLGDRLPRRPRGNGIAVAQAADWLALCELLCRGADDFDHETRRGWVIACRLLGLGWRELENALTDVRHFGSAAAAQAWASFLGEPDERFVGKLYTADAVGQPGIIKVGFSRRPNDRMVQLARIQHRHVRLISTRPATMLHEWALHHAIIHPVEPEWYPVGELPDFLRPAWAGGV